MESLFDDIIKDKTKNLHHSSIVHDASHPDIKVAVKKKIALRSYTNLRVYR
jgi:hypothetical protein